MIHTLLNYTPFALWFLFWVILTASKVHAVDKCTGKEYGWEMVVAAAFITLASGAFGWIAGKNPKP